MEEKARVAAQDTHPRYGLFANLGHDDDLVPVNVKRENLNKHTICDVKTTTCAMHSYPCVAKM